MTAITGLLGERKSCGGVPIVPAGKSLDHIRGLTRPSLPILKYSSSLALNVCTSLPESQEKQPDLSSQIITARHD